MKVTEDEICDAINSASDHVNEGLSRYPAMTYEEGIRDALEWVLTGEDNPMGDE